MNIDQRLHEAADDLRAALADIPVSDPPQRPTHPPPGRIALTVLSVGLVGALTAGLVFLATNDDNGPVTTDHTTTDGGPASSETTTVPVVVGTTIGQANALLEQAGLVLSVHEGDATFLDAVVIAAEPGDGEQVATGSVVGVRTALPDPPLSVECPSARHPRDGASPDALPQVGQVARAGAEATVLAQRSQIPPGSDTEIYLGIWDRWAYLERDGAVVTEPTSGFQIIVVTPSEADCAATAPTFELAPVTYVFGDPARWAGSDGTTSTTTSSADAATRALLEKAEADPEDYRAPSQPTLSVTPSDGLVDGQVLAVLGEGLPPGEQVGIAACAPWDRTATTDPQCLYTSSGTGTVDAQGRLWFPDYKLAALEPAIGFNCAQPPGCELAWYVGIGEPPRVTAAINVTG